MKKSHRVLVTGVGGRSFGHQILHALLLLGNKYHVVTTDADPFSFGLYQTSSRYIVPLAHEPDYLAAIQRIVKKERITALLPGTEAENLAIATNRQNLLDLGCTVIAGPTDIIQLCNDKAKINSWLENNGFVTPQTTDWANWRTLVAKVGFPIIGKPTINSGGSRNVVILKSEQEIDRFLSLVPNKKEIIFQEYVGTAESEYTVGVVISRDGKIVDSIVMHRKLIGLSLGEKRLINNTSYALSTGYSQGFIIKHDLVQKSCEDLALKIGIRGPLNIQCRLSNGKLLIFEVHPRFSGTTSIRAEAGFNEPDILIRNFLDGEEFDRVEYQHDVAAIRAFRSILVPMQSITHVPRG